MNILVAAVARFWPALTSLPRERIRESGFTFLAQSFALAGGMAALFLAGRLLTATDFASYQVARRILSIVTFPILLGVGIGIPRYAAKSDRPVTYLVAGLVLTLPVLCLTCAVSLTAPTLFARLFFGDPGYAILTSPILFLVGGLYLHTIAYAYFRGTFHMSLANSLTIINQFVVVVAAIGFCGRAPGRLLTLTGLGWGAVSLAFLAHDVGRTLLEVRSKEHILAAIKVLAIFGLPRVPGEFALFGLFSLPTFLVSHMVGVEQAGMFSFGLSVMSLLASFFDFVGILLLPYMSRSLKYNGTIRTTKIALKILNATTGCSIIATIIAVFAIQYPIIWFMGSDYAAAIISTKILILASPAYVAFIVLRNYIDAVAIFPFNTINIIAVLCFICSGIFFYAQQVSAEIIITVGVYLLAVESYFVMIFMNKKVVLPSFSWVTGLRTLWDRGPIRRKKSRWRS